MRRPHWIALTTLALGGLVVGLLLPAITKIREAAARTRCTSNLKQLGIALHAYSDTHPRTPNAERASTFPAGTIPNPDLPPERRLSWVVSILPYLEQSPVYEQFDRKAAVDDERNRTGMSFRFPQTVCPGSGQPRTVAEAGTGAPAPLTHYVGVAGVGPDAATLPTGHPQAGVFGYDRRTAFSDILDGTSNTLLVIETGLNPGHWAFGGPATVRGVEPNAAPHVGPGRPFGGFHDGGRDWFRERSRYCLVGLADASVRTLTDAVAPEVLAALATVAGKEPLPAEW